MRLLINILLLAICAIIVYFIVGNVKEPIVFQAALDKREGAVIKQLEKVRTAQEIYKRMTGEYAATFDTLKQVLKTGNIETYKIIGNMDDIDAEIQIDTLFTKAADSVRTLGISIDSLDIVPYAEPGVKFSIDADTLTYQNTLVNVVEVGVQKKKYMGKFGDTKYRKYNNFYNPDDMLKFGDMNSPNTSGNWRN